MKSSGKYILMAFFVVAGTCFLNTLAKGIFTFDSIQQTGLEGIATQCPVTGGSAVFKARSLLELVGDYEYDDEAVCDSLAERSQAYEESLKGLKVESLTFIPNPSSGLVIGNLPYSIEEGQLNLFNSQGIEVLSLKLDKGIDTFELDISGFSPGIYYCLVRDDAGNMFTQKLVISN